MNGMRGGASIGGLVFALGLGLGGCEIREKPLFPMVSGKEFVYVKEGPNSSFFEPLEGKRYCKVETESDIKYVPVRQIKIDQLFYGGRKYGDVKLEFQCGVVKPMSAEDVKKVEEMHRHINPPRLF